MSSLSVRTARGQFEIPSMVARILSGSCAPATDLMAAVEAGKVDESKALHFFNARLFPQHRALTLADAARAESAYCARNDI